MDPVENNEDNNSTLSHVDNRNKTQCPHCGKYYIRVNTHISRAHPLIHRQNLISRQPSTKFISAEGKQLDSEPHHSDQTPTISSTSPVERSPLDQYKTGLQYWNQRFQQNLDDNVFNTYVNDFATFLSESIYLLPGPKHPAYKYIEARKAKKNGVLQRSYQQHSNPQRKSKRDKEKRINKYKYDEIQFLYYNQRRKAIRKVVNKETPVCKINIQDITNHFKSIFSSPNNCIRDEYISLLTPTQQLELDETFVDCISKQEIVQTMKKMSVDTAPGPDRVIFRAINDDLAINIISIIATRMLHTRFIPTLFKKARTVLIYKTGDVTDL